jgi:Domain of unknown function (DUF4383)
MKAAQSFSLVIGTIFLVLGIMGVVPGLVHYVDVSSKVSDVYGIGYGYIAGIVPTNGVETFIRIIVGVLGITASISLGSAYIYSRSIAVFYGLFAVLGLVPYARTFFGTVPFYGSNVLLHGVSAVLALYFGFLASPGLLELSSSNAQRTVQGTASKSF